MSTISEFQKEKIAEFANTLYPDDTPASFALRAVLAEGITLYVQQLPNGNIVPPFEVGERVEYVEWEGSYKTDKTRGAEVISVDMEARAHHFMRVRFDDGEERYINPDVMRKVKA